MEVIKTDIDGVVLIKPTIFTDSRGYFFESFNELEFINKVGIVDFVQDNESKSSYGVVRGLHFQLPPHSQAKLVRCVKGHVFDVAVDLREGSPTYGKYVGFELSEENHLQLFIPKGFAHGFSVLSNTAVFQYKCDEFYHPEVDGGINMLDETIEDTIGNKGINWHVPKEKIILSDKDTKHPKLKDFKTPFKYD